MKTLRPHFLTAAAVGALLTGFGSAANATPSITVDPAAISAGLTSSATVADITIHDYAIIAIDNSGTATQGNWTEVANFNSTAFDGVVTSGINQPGAGGWQLFGTFTASGTSTFVTTLTSAHQSNGIVTSMSVTLLGQAGNTVSLTTPTTLSPVTLAQFGITGAGSSTTLGTAALDPLKPTGVSADFSSVPPLQASGSFSAGGKVTPVLSAFWLSPSAAQLLAGSLVLDALVAATASSNLFTEFTGGICPANDVCIRVGDPTTSNQGGGGDITFDITSTIPEPSSIGLLGAALFGLGWLGRRRTRKA